MIPDNPNIYKIDDTNRMLVGPFKYPDNIVNDDELVDFELGGLALQDTSEGLEYQTWKAELNTSGDVILTPLKTGDPVVIFTEPGVQELAFTFDQNMRWAAATRLAGNNVNFRWYDTTVGDYVITPLTGITSVRVALDDKRVMQIQSGNPDMILTYIRDNRVRWRIQRDRFQTEYTYSGQLFSDNIRITHFGMSEKLRLQWRLAQRRIK